MLFFKCQCAKYLFSRIGFQWVGNNSLLREKILFESFSGRQIDAELQDEPSASQRKRIFHLMQKFSDVFPVQVSLAELLKLPNLTDKEEVLLRMYESDVFEKTWEDYKTQMKAMEVSTNRKKDNIRAA